jgi:nucleoside-diphosphate-sugar epimerase
VRAVDQHPVDQWHQVHDGAERVVADLRLADACDAAVRDARVVYNLAADMGGMGFIEANRARCMLSVLINTHLLQSALATGVQRFFFSSSACVYAQDKQLSPDITPLKEADAYPADAEDGYGWEKLFSERMCRHFSEDFGLVTRVARYHNVYGPHGTWTGGREKAPAAICRKVAEAKLTGRHEIEIWGDGEQTRSFMYIDDCVEGTLRIMASDITEPINLGSSEMVTINELVDIVEEIAGIRLERRYDLEAPKGVRGRNSDNAMILERLGWEPRIGLREGLECTYRWIYDQVSAAVVPS